jgi:hypothetical protein
MGFFFVIQIHKDSCKKEALFLYICYVEYVFGRFQRRYSWKTTAPDTGCEQISSKWDIHLLEVMPSACCISYHIRILSSQPEQEVDIQNSFHQKMHPLLNIQNVKTYN